MDGVAANITAYSHNLSNAVSFGFKQIQAQIDNSIIQASQAEKVFSEVFYILILNQHIQAVVDLMDKIGSDCS